MQRLTSASLIVALAIGCGSDDEVIQVTRRSPQQEEAVAAQGNYDLDGHLLPSTLTVAGLVLPRGTELRFERERQHTYISPEPYDVVQAYFGPRLLTTNIVRMGDGAIFRQALPHGVQGTQVKLDVGIFPTPDQRTRIEVNEYPPAPAVTRSEEELVQQHGETIRRLD